MGSRADRVATYRATALAQAVRLAGAFGVALALSGSGGAAVAAPSETTLFGFDGIDGLSPSSGLVRDGNGNLYGVTIQGGVNTFHGELGFGVAYMLTAPPPTGGPWTATIMHFFGQTPGDGIYPNGTLLPFEDGFYGAANNVVFRLGPPIIHDNPYADGTYAETILYTFAGGTDGLPNNSLIMDEAGALYGTTGSGGASGNGTVFRLDPPAAPGGPWTETQLYQFQGPATEDGAGPSLSLTMDAGGTLYGVTPSGGGKGCSPGTTAVGCGTVFALAPPAAGSPAGTPWTETVLYRFKDDIDGASPSSPLLLVHGALYGVTVGYANPGTAYALVPPAAVGGAWRITILHRFTNPHDGTLPIGTLVMAKSGTQDVLIGTTYTGGIAAEGCFYEGCGTVFALTAPAGGGAPWNPSILHSFTGGGDGGFPDAGVIMDHAGNIYGTTEVGGFSYGCAGYYDIGCGAVFEITP